MSDRQIFGTNGRIFLRLETAGIGRTSCFYSVIEGDYAFQELGVHRFGDCAHVLIEAVGVPIGLLAVDECVRGIDARVEYEQFAQFFVLDAKAFRHFVELAAKTYLRGKPSVFHIFDEFRRCAVGDAECVPGIVAVL